MTFGISISIDPSVIGVIFIDIEVQLLTKQIYAFHCVIWEKGFCVQFPKRFCLSFFVLLFLRVVIILFFLVLFIRISVFVLNAFVGAI